MIVEKHLKILLATGLSVLVGACSTNSGEVRTMLPFAVRVTVTHERTSDQPEAGRPRFAKYPRYEDDLANALRKKGVFTRIVGDKEPADLNLDVIVRGEDFGRPEPHNVFGSVGLWFLAGHLSWTLDDVSYPDADLYAAVSLSKPQSSASRVNLISVETDSGLGDLPLKDITLKFRERVGQPGWILNIFLPPQLVPVDNPLAGHNLSRKTVARIAEHVAERFPSKLLERHLEEFGCLFYYDENGGDEGVVTLFAQEAVREIRVGDLPPLSPNKIANLPGEGMAMRDFFAKTFETVPAGRFYRISLENEVGWVRLNVRLLSRSASATIHRGAP